MMICPPFLHSTLKYDNKASSRGRSPLSLSIEQIEHEVLSSEVTADDPKKVDRGLHVVRDESCEQYHVQCARMKFHTLCAVSLLS